MKRQQVTRNNQQSKNETPLVSGILQRYAVSPEMDDVQSKDDHEAQALINSAFSQDFSKVPISGTKPQQFVGTNQQGHLISPIQAKWTSRQSDDQYEQAAQLQIAANHPAQQQQPTQKKASPEPSRRENNTGLPDNLRSGIETLSGYSMDDVKVHYNSDQPTKLQAHAYAQGSDIYLGSGQEKHLPHEAWHVVQQKQGRVKPTMQMKGKVNVNDDSRLEKEADVMGAKALQFVDNRRGDLVQRRNQQTLRSKPKIQQSGSDPVQRAVYMRALTGDNRVANEVESLRRVFENETTRQHQVNTWVDGFAGMPTARNHGNDKHYYSPVGYSLETNEEADVWANYRGDGNTNDIPVTVPRWVTAAQAMRQAALEVGNYTAWAEQLNDDPYGLIPEVNQDTAIGARNSYINYYLAPYLSAPTHTLNGEVIDGRIHGQQAVRAAITAAGLESLREHYGTRPDGAAGERFMGSGVEPDGMDEALEDQDTPYIESILHARFGQVRSAWYNRDFGNYAEAVAQNNWRDYQEDWLANRRNSAQAIRTAFNDAGANINVEIIGPQRALALIPGEEVRDIPVPNPPERRGVVEERNLPNE